ncbi:multiple C2 domain and transmembrane region protein 6 [Amaranthus tricolor]|uniref:multiple C2 domain and transmembrane region protein 6 n=1 Tax=Amaranthus tricolor TaxID=29722 RepID=UPI00258707F3|nr:multiple C2 domain and transmembrane region protein 6 [Amaranthus tricolor]
MAKLVVEVLEASDLMPKDGQGSASPYVEVDFSEQKQRTQTKFKDLNPVWNETLVFRVPDPENFPNKTIEVTVFNDRKSEHGQQKNFLGRVRISGVSVPVTETQAVVQRYPLDKRGIFSHIKGDIALRMFLVGSHEPSFNLFNVPVKEDIQRESNFEAPSMEDINPNIASNGGNNYEETNHHNHHHDKKKNKKEKEKPEVRTFYSIPAKNPTSQTQIPQQQPPPQPPPQVRADFMKAGPPPAMMMQVPGKKPDYDLVETRPPVAAHMGYRKGDNIGSTYDMVEQMHYLYVSVVKARDLPVMDITGSLDPYVEVKLGNYKGVTKHLEKNQNPIWNQIFAFSKERLQSNLLELVVKDKDFGKDDFVGRILFDLSEVPLRVPPDSPLAPQWYKLEDKKGVRGDRGEIMLAVWIGTQADEAFPEAWHSDAHSISHHNLANTRSKVYFSPKLYYLRVHVIEAQDLIPSDRTRPPMTHVKVQLGNQLRVTRPSSVQTMNPIWNDELMFVASEPFDEFLIVSVEDKVGPGQDEILGRMIIPVREIPHRMEISKLPDSRWCNLHKHSVEEDGEKKDKGKFASKIHLRFWLEAGYHVLDESTHFSSDLQPSSKLLRKAPIGILELGILSAKNLVPMKGKEGRLTDPYCVAKYGNKWVRTRTLLDTLAPKWNEQYTWEVFDPCTVITIGVFDNCHVSGKDDARDQRIGKVRIRLSTLETDRIYSHYYPLLVLSNGGLKKHGELQLAVRFTCTAWVNMVAQYGRPLLPKMHYVQPIPVRHIDWLRHQAMQIVSARLARAEPPLRREVVEFMLDVDIHMFSLRRSKANFFRIMSVLSGISAVCRWSNDICTWRNPITTCLVHVLFLILVCYPELILPTIFLYLFAIGVWNYRFRPRHPPHMDARISHAEYVHPDELDEEFDTFPTSRPNDVVRMRYDRLRSVAGRVQAVVGDLATQGERTQALLNWRDPRATAIFIFFSLILAVILYVTPFQVLAVLVGLYMLRHPRFRSKMPSVPVNFFKRLPAKSDMLL